MNTNTLATALDGFAAIAPTAEPEDYVQDGLLMCGHCHTRKQMPMDIPFLGGMRLVPVGCQCAIAHRDARDEAARRREFQRRQSELRAKGIADPDYMRYRFEADDGNNQTVGAVCRRYVDEWPQMRGENIGMLLYGGVGTGKSFFAACIANALLDQCIPAGMTTIGRTLNQIQATYEGKQGIIDRLRGYELLVIDDLGAERDTEYAAEQVFNIIDGRVRTGRPMIVTTNLDLRELEHPQDLRYRRIFSRVLEACPIRMPMEGEDRRKANGDAKAEAARRILLGRG